MYSVSVLTVRRTLKGEVHVQSHVPLVRVYIVRSHVPRVYIVQSHVPLVRVYTVRSRVYYPRRKVQICERSTT